MFQYIEESARELRHTPKVLSPPLHMSAGAAAAATVDASSGTPVDSEATRNETRHVAPRPVESARIKVAVVGHENTGKTALVRHLTGSTFLALYTATINVDYRSVQRSTDRDDIVVTLMYSDCGGSQRFGQAVSQQLRFADIILVVFDLASVGQPDYAEYVRYIIRGKAEHARIVLVGTHLDLLPHEIDGRDEVVARVKLLHLIHESIVQMVHMWKVFTVSSKTGEGMDDLSKTLAEMCTTCSSYVEAMTYATRQTARLDVASARSCEEEQQQRPEDGTTNVRTPKDDDDDDGDRYLLISLVQRRGTRATVACGRLAAVNEAARAQADKDSDT